MIKSMKKNDEFELSITGLGNAGEGIGHYEGMAVFVPGALPGDVILAGATKVKKKYAFARIIRMISASEDRMESPCPISDKCGGCSLMSLSYAKQLEYKGAKVREDLIRIGGFDPEYVDSVMEPVIGMDEPFRYRNKAQYPVGEDRGGEIITGFYAPHSHRIVPCADCMIGDEGDAAILRIVKMWMTDNNIPAYDEESGKGFVRHVLIRRGITESSQEIMVCLITNGEDTSCMESLIAELSGTRGIRSIVCNINTRRDNVILGKKTITLWGSDHITDMSLGLSFKISPRSFFQVNRKQTVKLYDKALEYAALTGRETVWDLYCGIGSISLFLAKKAGKVYGVEIVPDAILDARENARRNGITNAFFMTGAAEEVIPDFYTGRISFEDDAAGGTLTDGSMYEARDDMKHPDVIVVDPPRKGCDERLLGTMIAAGAGRIVYVSCDPATLARDLKILCADGFCLEKVCPCDMFGNSYHVETVAKLVKNKQ